MGVRGLSCEVALPLVAADAEVRRCLAAEGFGVLTVIDLAATLRERLGVERAPLLILGACHPALAHRALTIDSAASLLLPCNVVLEGLGPERTRVTAVDPLSLLTLPELEPVAAEASARLGRVLAAVAERLPVLLAPPVTA
ncbi:MAG TPA: DUF302 domain-containing protein [Verrucomicrobiae bacterium]|nr:DUF302 domain-containing protein [Verrucomicrobiae bacterium]